MTENEKFEQDGRALQLTHALADYAESIVGDEDAGAILIGAAMRVWKRKFGDEHAMNLAKVSLSSVISGSNQSENFQ